MDQSTLFYEDIYDAIEKQIASSGRTKKEISARLFPGRTPETSKSLLSRALSRENTDVRMTIECLLVIMEECGSDHIMAYLSDRFAYERPRSKTKDDFKREIQDQFNQMQKAMMILAGKLEKVREE